LKGSTKKILLTAVGLVALATISAIGGALIYVSSPQFKETARQYVLRAIESETGGRATIGRLYWDWWTQRVSILDLTIRGSEPADAAPLAHIESIEAGINIKSLLKRRLDLFELTVTRPELRLTVDSMGNTNLPSPPPKKEGRSDFQISIENFTVAQGTAFVNERRIDIGLVVRNLESELSYQGASRILAARLSYDGVLNRPSHLPIPYSLSSEFDFTRNTILARNVVVSSGKSRIQLQGRINDVLSGKVSGRLDYSGNGAFQFLNYFYPKESFSGETAMAGMLEFSPGSFHTQGSAKGDRVAFAGWEATSFRGDYDYRYPEKRLTVERLSAGVLGGTATGEITVVSIPGPAHFNLNLAYNNIDGMAMAKAFPWDRKYRIESRVSGKMQGWFEGRLERYEFTGDASLAAATIKAESGVVSLPLDGTLAFTLRPKEADISRANLLYRSTSIVADGPVNASGMKLNVRMASSDLSDLRFLYADANGTGSFEGILTGSPKSPIAEGTFDLRQHKYRDWTIELASGTARLDMPAGKATVSGVRVVQGQSQITLNGTTGLDGTNMDLRLQSAQVRAEDTAPFVKQKLGGVFSGAIHLTSLKPLRFDGDVRAVGLVVEGQTLRDVLSHVQYDDPTLTLQNISASDNGSTLTGRATYNMSTEAMTFAVRVNSINLNRLRAFGMPDEIEGVIQQADLTGAGTRARPEIDGTARLRNLSFRGEAFPTARVDVNTMGSLIDLKVSEALNLDLSARIDTAGKGYPFTAEAAFRRYSIEQLAGFSRGTMVVTGDASLKGSLSDIRHVTGTGHINPIEIAIQGQTLRSTRPFEFDFNSERLNLTSVSLVSSTGAQITMAGTVGLTPGARLNLQVTGQVDAGLLSSNEVEHRWRSEPQGPDWRHGREAGSPGAGELLGPFDSATGIRDKPYRAQG
jgi:hypothetical protein